MSQAIKRISKSSVNWQKLSERLTAKQQTELAALKIQNTTFSSQVNRLPAELPKIDFAALKKQLPAQAAILDTLQKQYESISIPYGSIPDKLNAEISKWCEFNDLRIKFHELKTIDGAEEAKKVEEKWSKAPPVEQFTRQHFPQYFPKLHYDLRVTERFPDPLEIGLNDDPALYEHYKDYKINARPGRVSGH